MYHTYSTRRIRMDIHRLWPINMMEKFPKHCADYYKHEMLNRM